MATPAVLIIRVLVPSSAVALAVGGAALAFLLHMWPVTSTKSAATADAVLLVAFHTLRGGRKARTDASASLNALVGAEYVEQGEVVVTCRETLRNAADDRVDGNRHLVLLVNFRL